MQNLIDFLETNPTTPSGDVKDLDRALSLYKSGLITLNEAREIIGLPPRKEGDHLIRPLETSR